LEDREERYGAEVLGTLLGKNIIRQPVQVAQMKMLGRGITSMNIAAEKRLSVS
jgi:hypothetical protein